MSLPETVRRRVAERLGPVSSASPVGGGSISAAHRIALPTGPAFLKHHPTAPPGFFPAEARGLDALRDVPGGPRIPEVLAVFDAADEGDAGEASWIALEWLEPGRTTAAYSEALARAVAALHAPISGENDISRDADARVADGGTGGGWGWDRDNFIGELPQENAPVRDGTWAGFWRERRLEPQLRLARDAGRMPGRARDWDALFARLPDLLASAEGEGPALLHGDLWSGNVLALASGGPALVDPAVYRGHREVDLAMADLFGGFDARFHAAYREARPLREGYEARRPVYQLYYLLVHVVLFGGGYAGQTEEALRRALAAG